MAAARAIKTDGQTHQAAAVQGQKQRNNTKEQTPDISADTTVKRRKTVYSLLHKVGIFVYRPGVALPRKNRSHFDANPLMSPRNDVNRKANVARGLRRFQQNIVLDSMFGEKESLTPLKRHKNLFAHAANAKRASPEDPP